MAGKHSEQDIRVLDHLVPDALQQALTAMVSRPIWQYGWRSNVRRDRFCFWHAHFAGGAIDSVQSCEDELMRRADAAPFAQLWTLLKQGPLKHHVPVRAYANSHTYGVEGYVHTDNDEADNGFSTIYYAHPVWNRNWGGETVFFANDNRNIVKAVYPQPGRLVSFPGSIPHCAHSPSRDCADLRISIVLKTRIA